MSPPLRRILAGAETSAEDRVSRLVEREWLVTNGLGGYASGTLAGVPTRRYHGLLVSALPAPLGRTLMLDQVSELLRMPDGREVMLSGAQRPGEPPEFQGLEYLEEIRLEDGLPVWRYRFGALEIERRILRPHFQNTVQLQYRIVAGAGPVRLKIRPTVHFRSHDEPVSTPLEEGYTLTARNERLELTADGDRPPLRLVLHGRETAFTLERRVLPEALFRVEEDRGYASRGQVWSPGYFRCTLEPGESTALVASTEEWEIVEGLEPSRACQAERRRRAELLAVAGPLARAEPVAELVLAADQFLVTPVTRRDEVLEAKSRGEEQRTVIAGYHWFTDWGRDTMISLEGLALVTGRHEEARHILLRFADHVRDGLIPNFFSEHQGEGLYHTADASLWFFHAVDRYVEATGDEGTLRRLLPRLEEIVEAHRRGTRFGIGVAEDGLLRQGEEGYQLTWMDAKVDDWVVTPRRGKAVEINGLWYNALRLLADWRERLGTDDPAPLRSQAEVQRRAFNDRFWRDELGHLLDVVDGEEGDDPALRPNQLLAFSLKHPVLDEARWPAVLAAVERELLTPVGLRSLAPGHPDYQRLYFGDLRARDAAYHQGTVWGWLIGPFVDAWLKVHPGRRRQAREFLSGLLAHLGDACLGSMSEIFDAEPPHTPRGCIAQAWTVAEVLRCWTITE